AFAEAQIAFKAIAHRTGDPAGGWSDDERLQQLEHIETLARILPALAHQHLNELAHAPVEELGGSLARVLADRLGITRAEARRRIEDAADLGERRALTGDPLAPKLRATAQGQQAGLIGVEHVRIIRGFFTQLPCCIDEPTRADAERQLATVAAAYRPDEL